MTALRPCTKIAAMRKRQRGFTLMEIMTGLLVMAILMAIAIPSFRSFTARTRVTAATNQLVVAMNYARGEAVHLATPVSLCASSDHLTCDTTNWAAGWIVFSDGVAPTGAVDTGDTILQTFPAVSGVSMTGTDSGSLSYLKYDNRGMKSVLSKYTFEIWTPGCTGNQQSELLVSPVGSIQSSYRACP
jgi:type IV fimbrial biogenesis protein FimT